MRVEEHNHIIKFTGRTDDAQLPFFLSDYLKKVFTHELFEKQFSPEKREIILFGEGYGKKTQSRGKSYRNDVAFILYDVLIDSWWLNRKDVKDIAKKLQIGCVPDFGIMDTMRAVEFVETEPFSLVSKERMPIEGVVARSHPLMLFRDGIPIMWKLKLHDYQKLKN